MRGCVEEHQNTFVLSTTGSGRVRWQRRSLVGKVGGCHLSSLLANVEGPPLSSQSCLP